MQVPTDDASIPTKYKINAQIVGVRTRRKVANRTRPLFLPAIAAEIPALSTLEDEDLPAAKRPRLQAPPSTSTATDGVVHAHTADTVTTGSLDDTPADAMPPAASLPRAKASRAPTRRWALEEDAKLTEAMKKHGNDWVAVAVLVPGRRGDQCRKRWVNNMDPVRTSNVAEEEHNADDDEALDSVPV
jgi:hypothetical protein